MSPFLPASASFGRTIFGMAAIAIAGGIHAQGTNPLNDEEDEDDLPAMQMLIEGSILQGVMMPQYDEAHRLTSVMRAEKLTMVTKDLIRAERLRIDFYNPDRSPKGEILLKTAELEDKKILRSDDPVSLSSDGLNLEGAGLVYELRESRGFLHGPAKGSTLIDTRTSMKSPSKSRAVIAGAMIAAASGAPAEELETLDPQQMKGLDHLAASGEVEASAAAEKTAADLAESDARSKKAGETLDDFLRGAAIDKPTGRIPDLKTEVPGPGGEDMKEPATFSADEGVYFDSEAGLLIFLKNVRAAHPEFTLTGADEVKVFLDKEKTAAKPKESGKIEAEEAGKLLGGAKFGDPSRIIATGTIVVEKVKTKPGDKGAKASGRQMVFDFKSGELIIRGGQPWVLADTAEGRVLDPDGYIRINVQTGDASFVGKAEGFVETGKTQ